MRHSTIKQPKLAINHSEERGFTLVMVMGVMIIIALMIIAGAQISNAEMRISANEADHKYALSIAEDTLRFAEKQIQGELEGYLPPMSKADIRAYKDADWRTYPEVLAPLLEKGPEMPGIRQVFTNDCTNGLCAPAIVIEGRQYGGEPGSVKPAWARANILTGNDKDNSRQPDNTTLTEMGLTNDAVAKPPRYIIEFLGRTRDGVSLCRITVRAWGRNENTVVILQSYLRIRYA